MLINGSLYGLCEIRIKLERSQFHETIDDDVTVCLTQRHVVSSKVNDRLTENRFPVSILNWPGKLHW